MASCKNKNGFSFSSQKSSIGDYYLKPAIVLFDIVCIFLFDVHNLFTNVHMQKKKPGTA
jgi:hypothetical protein